MQETGFVSEGNICQWIAREKNGRERMGLPCNSGLVPINQVWEYGHDYNSNSGFNEPQLIATRANSSFWQPKKKTLKVKDRIYHHLF